MDIRITRRADGHYVAEDHQEHCTNVDTSPVLALIGLLTYTALDDALPFDEDDEDARYDLLSKAARAASNRVAGKRP